MKPEIKELYKISEDKYESMYEMMLEAFSDYPKLQFAFPERKKLLAAIEMVLRYYGAYDICHGNAYSLDEEVNEVVALMHSDYEGFADELVEEADCENEAFLKAAELLNAEEQQLWWDLFEELDRQEAALNIPKPHLYVDFLAVRKGRQGQGRGTELIRKVCRYADSQKLPVMLFTNGEEDIRFYIKNGFRIIGVTKSEEFGFENTYMWYEPEAGNER